MQDHINVSGVLCSSYDPFFEAEKKIADYILEHKSEIIDMTVAELALASGTSDATVSRFCRRCGFNGFHHLKITLAKEVAEERGKSVEVSNDISRDNIAQSLQNILANKAAELTQTVSMMDPVQLGKILELIGGCGEYDSGRLRRRLQVQSTGHSGGIGYDLGDTDGVYLQYGAGRCGDHHIQLRFFQTADDAHRGGEGESLQDDCDHQQRRLAAGSGQRLPHHNGDQGEAAFG